MSRLGQGHTIARIGDFALRTKQYLGDKIPTTHDIEIVQWTPKYCYTIADFNDDGEIVSCGNRLLEALIEDFDCVGCVSQLAEIAYMILNSDDVPVKVIEGQDDNRKNNN